MIMELEELKSTWQSVKPEIKSTGYVPISNKIDIKTRLLRKILFGELFSLVCLILMATSRLWSPTKLSALWLTSYCGIILVAIICGIGLYLAIRHVNLWEDSNTEILSAIVRIKKHYRRIELGISILIMPLLIWLSLMPPFVDTPDMYIVWGLTAIGFGSEYLWYRSNVRQLNILGKWEDD